MFYLTIVLGGVVLWLFNYWKLNSQFQLWKNRGIPYSTLTPFKQLFLHIFTNKGIVEQMCDNYKKFEGHKFFGQFQIFTPLIMIRDVDLIHRICIKDFSYFLNRNMPADTPDLFTDSLGGVTGDQWRTLRHKMTPTFTSGKLKMMFFPIKEGCDEAVSFINRKIGIDIEARDFVFKFVLNTFGNTLFGLKVDAFNEAIENTNQFLKLSKAFFKPSFSLMVKFMFVMTMPKIKKILKLKIIDEKVETFYRNLVKDIIEHRKRTGEVRNDFLQLLLEQKKKEDEESLYESTNKNRKSTDSVKEQGEDPEDRELLDQLKYMQDGNDNYKTKKVFTDDCIVSQTFLFISGGSETLASGLSFVLYELSHNPTYQKRVQQEVDNVIAKQGFNYQSIKSMTYMEQFIYESLRLHTTAPLLTRICTQNYNIPGTDVILEKGAIISLPIRGIMNDPQYFPEPDKFNPDNFDDINTAQSSAFLAFGIGPRTCIAKRLAMLKMKMLVATILQHFIVKLSPKTKLPIKIMKSSVFVQAEGGLWILFERRNKQ